LRLPLLDCPFAVELSVKIARVSAHRLLSLSPGQLLALPEPVAQLGALVAGGRELFTGMVARRGESRAVQLLERSRVAEQKEVAS